MAPDKGKRSKGTRKPRKVPRPVAPPLADAGPPDEVRWHPEADAERDASWPPGEKVAMFHSVEKLEAVGAALGSPALKRRAGGGGRGSARVASARRAEPLAPDLSSGRGADLRHLRGRPGGGD